MTEEVKRAVKILRYCSSGNDGTICEKCPYAYRDEEAESCVNILFRVSANLIESLSAELEQMERKRDAAVRHLLERHKTICPTCIHRIGTGCDKNATTGPDEEVIFCADYEWCGYER